MEPNTNTNYEAPSVMPSDEESSSFNFATIYSAVVLNWKWFLLSLVLCLGVAYVYLRYTTPIYQAGAKLLVKDNDQNSGYNSKNVMNSATLGLISNSNGIDNEMEILKSHSLAQQATRDLKLYVNYYAKGKFKDHLLYLNQPITVDVDPSHLEKLNAPINLQIERTGNSYHVTGTYYIPVSDNKADGPYSLDKTISKLPATIGTKAGLISLTANSVKPMADGAIMKASIISPRYASYKYVGELGVSLVNKDATIVQLILRDEIPERAVDYLQQLTVCYNQQANDDKNEVARRTEEFINGRLEKINAELGSTEGELENYKKENRMVELKMNATQSVANADAYSQKLNEANTQVALLDEMRSYVNNPNNRYQALPSNVGLTDQASTSLINNYNEVVQKRNLLLQSASESSPAVVPLTTQLDQLEGAIKRALDQARRNMLIQRSSVASQYGKYQGEVGETPEQERMLTQIGRQQEVKSGLYLMLLQKREENSISLAATADKGKLIDAPAAGGGPISPKKPLIMLIALILGIAIPSAIIFLTRFFRYKIEGHDDVASLTKLPILGDVAVASEAAKTKAEIVVHENRNNTMEEIFRSMRTNLQFMMEEGQKVILTTSSQSGEGKTFVTSNLAVSFALLGKKVVLVGLDIRKPRLAELFGLSDRNRGITNLLTRETPTWEQVVAQIQPSGVNNNLDILAAGPIPPNPAELVTRPSLDTIFQELRDHYDYIIIDTSPVGLVTDTISIARVADCTIYMCRADYTPKDSFDFINGLAAENKLPKMSIVINGIDMSKKKYGYYYGYGRYGKYGRYGGYGHYGHRGGYGSYGTYGVYGGYGQSHYGDKNDNSVKV